MEIKEYYDNPAISQSRLKILLGEPSYFNVPEEQTLYFQEKEHFTIGSAVDCILTQGEKVFEDFYHVSSVENKPSDTIKSILHQVFDSVKTLFGENVGNITNYADIVLRCCNEHKYQSNWGDSTRINKICESWEYWEDLKKSQNKTVLSLEEYAIVTKVVQSLQENIHTSKYFSEEGNVEILNQLPIYFKYEDIDCKALLDRVIINHDNKTIQPIDIKTTGESTFYFHKKIKKFGYYIQASWYTEALKHWVSDKKFSGYRILPFKFIVESTSNVGTPLIYTCSENLLKIGKEGRSAINLIGVTEEYEVSNITYEAIKGFDELIALYKYYLENGFEVHKKIKENNSELIVDWEGIIN